MKRKYRWVFFTGLILLALVAMKIVLFLSAEPKVTVNYFAKYNEISKPEGFDPNDNADELYKKAGDTYVKPSGLAVQARNRPYEDINEAEKAALREWLEQNGASMEYLEEGNKRKFFWAEEDEQRDGILSLNNLGPSNIYDLTGLLGQRARIAAMDGRFEDALTALLECWKIGQHYSNPKLLWPQEGMLIKEHALKTAFMILDCLSLDANDLRLWQERWQKKFNTDDYIPGFQTQRLYYYNQIQRNFVYHPKDKGRLAWKMAKYFTVSCCDSGRYNLKIFLSCFNGPTSNEVSQIVSSVCNYYQSIVDKTPWEVRASEADFESNLENLKEKQPILDNLIPNLRPTWWCYHRLKARSHALVTVIAALRYKADQDNYPENLGVLLKNKYLAQLPQDPFSDGPLVYHLLDNDFEIYSIEKDYKDDGGARFQGGNPISGIPIGDEVFWPPLRRGRKNMRFYHGDNKEAYDSDYVDKTGKLYDVP